MSSLIVTVVVVVIVCIVFGVLVLACALGWQRMFRMIGLDKKDSAQEYNDKQRWPQHYYADPRKSHDLSDWSGSPISSPAASPTASPTTSPRASRHSSDVLMQKGVGKRENV